MENEIEKIDIHVDSSDSGTDTEDELETYDEDTELMSRRKHGGRHGG